MSDRGISCFALPWAIWIKQEQNDFQHIRKALVLTKILQIAIPFYPKFLTYG